MQLTATFQAIPDLMFEVDHEGRRFVNYHAPDLSMLYESPDVFIGKPIVDILPEEAAETILRAIKEAAQTGKHYGAIYKLNIADEEKWYELSIAAKGDHKDPNCHFIVLARDITDRKYSEENIQKSEANLKEAQTIAHIGSWENDLLTGGVTWSDEAFRILGYEPGRIAPSHQLLRDRLHPSDKERVIRKIEECRKMALLFEDEFRVVTEDGTEKVVFVKANIVCDISGKPIKSVGVIHDITDRKKSEKALIESENRYYNILEISPLAIMLVRNGSYIYSNPAAVKMLGYDSSEEVENLSIDKTISKTDMENIRKRIESASFGNQNPPMN